MKRIALLLFLLCSSVFLGAQIDMKSPEQKVRKAIKLMDAGKHDESIELIKSALKEDKNNYFYNYELGYAYYLKQDYKSSIKTFGKLVNHPKVTDQLFSMLGNVYDLSGKRSKANKVYDEGLKKFPNSGRIWLEKGTIQFMEKKYSQALEYYEKGIEVDPKFSSNYYRATQIYLGTNEEVWGMVYGEIFMNLERGTKRTEEISKMLYNTYKSEIKIKNDTSYSISFSKNTISIDAIIGEKDFILPFGFMYETSLVTAIHGIKTINISTLNTIRAKFLEHYFNTEIHENFPCVLFDYQKKVQSAGHLEAYNYWVLLRGDEVFFMSWLEKDGNKAKWEEFLAWFSKNALAVDVKNRFFRKQYN